jgi:hypothetical protein
MLHLAVFAFDNFLTARLAVPITTWMFWVTRSSRCSTSVHSLTDDHS